jgi:hypothetical protein
LERVELCESGEDGASGVVGRQWSGV